MSRRATELADALAAVRARLADAAQQAGRAAADIELLPVTKYFPVGDVVILTRLGCWAFGESRDQEAKAKAEAVASEVSGQPVSWHMVGRIQRNKARSIASWASVVHSVGSDRVAAALDRGVDQARDAGLRSDPLSVYVQISLDGDPERGGVPLSKPESVDALCAQIQAAPGLRLVGLMGVPPLGADPDRSYATLAAELQRVQRNYDQRLGLSAGMTADMDSAVKHGSTCVRVGTAVLGKRPLTSP